jgi:D-sedoheptulose 7-phosphate isomerase
MPDHYAEVTEALKHLDGKEVEKAIKIIRIVKEVGGTIWLAGNGGSASTASHFANDLTKMGGVKAIAIPDMTALATAFGNDDGWERMYSNILQMHATQKDAVIGISCSGNSQNIINFLFAAKFIFRIGLTGPDEESKISNAQCDALIRAMSDEITVQEDVHSAVCHAIARALKYE